MRLQFSSSPRQFLRLLLWLRLGAVLGQSLTLIVVGGMLHVALPRGALLTCIAALAVLGALSALRLRVPWPATQLEIAGQLLLDIVQLTVMLYLSGGTTNPFASLYLVPIALAAAGLGWRYIAAIALTSVCAYGWLIAHFVPLGYPALADALHSPVPAEAAMSAPGAAMMSAGAGVRAFDMHMAGMQVTFLLCCALLISALSFMAAEIRRRDREAAALREAALRHEHLSAMGILAAGAAHELSTPLLSMSLLVEELQCVPALDAQTQEDLGLLGRQIRLCKDKLGSLLQAARQSRLPELRRASLAVLLQETLDQWRLMRPAARLEVRWQAGGAEDGAPAAPGTAMLRVDAGFSQALISLLDNAADASAAAGSSRVLVTVSCDAQRVHIAIDDEGENEGASVRWQQQAGKVVFTTKSGGFGLGLVLSHAHIDRLQGEVSLATRVEGGTRTLISLPREGPAESLPTAELQHG